VPSDLQEAVDSVKRAGARVLAREVDVRDLAAMNAVVRDAVDEFGRLDIVCANAGIEGHGLTWEASEEMWEQMIAVNLTGVWKTIKACVPQLISQKSGGSIILTSSVGGLIGFPNAGPYCATKHGVVGLMRVLARSWPHGIRVNTVNPGSISTPTVNNDSGYELFSGGKIAQLSPRSRTRSSR
jgi:NAD(P)-dependent dehydrogenase (short-subunit alcohol dehydrogenase family)